MSSPVPPHLSKPDQYLSGILHMTGASAAFALMAICVKWSSGTLPPLEVVFFRSLSGTLLISALMLWKGVPFYGKERLKMFWRGLSGFIALSLHFFTISKLPLGIAVMLNYTAPIFAAVLAFFFLGEKPSRFLWCMILLSFAGVYLLAVPTGIGLLHQGGEKSFSEEIFFISLALLSGIAAAVAYTMIRAIKHKESPFTIIFYFTLISTIGSSFYLFQGARWPVGTEWLGLAGVGIGAFFGQLWMTIAFRKAPASLVSPFSYITPALSFLAGCWLWKDPLTVYTIVGAGIIFLAGSLISLREAVYD